MAPAPRLVASLAALRAEANALYPNRDKSSDGWIGDPAHAGRVSDHNPDERGLVHAYDLDEDLDGNGTDAGAELVGLVAAIVGRRDPRVKYLIYERVVWRSYPKPGLPAWVPEPYTGVNAHLHHLHVSVLSTPVGETDTSPWFPRTPPPPVGRSSDMQSLATHPNGHRIDSAVIGPDRAVWHWHGTPAELAAKVGTYEWLGGRVKSIASTWTAAGEYVITGQGVGGAGDNRLYIKRWSPETGWIPERPGVWDERLDVELLDPEANV